MNVNLKVDRNSYNIQFIGKLELLDQLEFKKLVDSIFCNSIDCIEVNLTQLEYIDSVGIGMLIVLQEFSEKQQIKPKFKVSKDSQIDKVLNFAHLNQILQIEYNHQEPRSLSCG